MKIGIIILLFTSFQAMAVRVSSQERINLNVRNHSITGILKIIEERSNYSFLYENELKSYTRKIDMYAKDATIDYVMDQLLKYTDLSYQKMRNGLVVIIGKDNAEAANALTVRGIILDVNSNVLPNINIVEKGTANGTTSLEDGTFTLNVKDANAVLIVSGVGFETQEIAVKVNELMRVVLLPREQSLEDVVVVGFGTQKKKDVVGAVTSVSPSDLKIPSSNLTLALGGRIAGMIAFQNSGEPGRDNADFFIRGVTTFGYKKDPLILIDGVELTTTDLARLQPQDIASFSILKDATATAVYGARGANGVILITTKKGAVGKATIFLQTENSLSTPVENVEVADPVTYMKMANEARATRGLLDFLYSDEKIENTAKPGANRYIFPANDWKDELFKKYASNQRYYLSVRGGGGVARYFVSGSLRDDQGVLKVDKRNNFNSNIRLKSYTLRSNVDIDVTKTTVLSVVLNGNFDDYTGPIYTGDQMYYRVMHANPVLFPAYWPIDSAHQFTRHILFGNYDQDAAYINPYADMVKGYKDYSRSLMLAQLELNQKLDFLIPGLSWRTMMNTNRTSYFDVTRSYNPYYYSISGYDIMEDTFSIYPLNEQSGTEYLDYSEGGKLLTTYFYLESQLNYNRILAGKHNLSAMLIYMLNQRLDANAGNLQLSLPYRNLGLSGRFTYGYDSRYHVEFDFGYNGSERFARNNRFGFFPSAGLAWTVSNEKFFEPLLNVVSSLKFRGTYGLVGNDAIGAATDRFFYLSNVNMNSGERSARFGDGSAFYSQNGILVSRYANPDIGWEISKQTNIGMDLELFRDLDLKIDAFKQKRNHILMNRSNIPETMGLSAVQKSNVGEASSRGIDASLEYKKNFNDHFWMSGLGNFTYATSRFDVYDEPSYKESEYYRSRVGHPINQEFGYIAERLFIDDKEVRNAPVQDFGEMVLGGDIKYLDVNNDGRITAADLVPIGYPSVPEINYGFGISTGYKGVDFSVFFNGIARRSFWLNIYGDRGTAPFVNNTQVLRAYADSYWSESDQNVYAIWPRLSDVRNGNNSQPSTWFMRNGSFLRLKTLELGYTFPRHILRNMRVSNLRAYFSGMNLLRFSSFDLWDPEMGGNGLGYPIQKVYNIGLNVSFN